MSSQRESRGARRPRLQEGGLLLVILLLGVVITAAADSIELLD